MDPILDAAIRKLMSASAEAQRAGVSFAPEDQEAFIREETKGKFGLDDVKKRVGGIDTDINLRNVSRSVGQGALFNTVDELMQKIPEFVKGMGSTPHLDKMLPPAPDGTAEKEDTRLREELYRQAHPTADLLGAMAGGFLTGHAITPAASPGMSAAKAVARGTLVGGAAGAAAGAGAAEDGSGASGAVIPGAIGAGIGALIPGAAALLRLRNPAVRATARLDHAFEKSGGVDALQKSLDNIKTSGRGDVAMLGDLSNPLRREADFAANASDDVLVPLAEKVRARQSDAGDRLVNDVRDLRGDANAPDRLAELESSRRAFASGPEGYGGLRDTPYKFDIAPLAETLKKPTVAEAWKMARLAGDLKPGDALDQLLQKTQKGDRSVTFDDLQQLYRSLGGKVDQAYRSGNGALGAAYKTIKTEVEKTLEETVPHFKAVNAKYAARMNLERALQSGEEAWDIDDSRGLAKQVKALSPGELEQFRYGLASKMIAKLRSAATNRDEAKKIVDASPLLQDKLEQVFGDKKTFDEFMRRANVEADLAKMKGAVGGSETARRLMSHGFDPLEIGIHTAVGGPTGTIHAVANAAGKLVRGAATRNTARALGPKLMITGADDIEKLLKSFQIRPELLNPLFTHAAPAAASGLLTHF